MKKQSHRIFISEKLGDVSAEVFFPANPKAGLVMAHGAGAGMNHRFMVALAEAFALREVATLRYNLSYMEKGQKRPDPPAIAEKTIKQVISASQDLLKGLPLFVSGKSFGGRMTSQLLSKEKIESIQGVIFFGFPLHAAGAPDTSRAAHLSSVNYPMLFLQGTRDALAKLELITQVCNALPNATLVQFEGADHSFKSGKKEFIEELAEEATSWMKLKR